METGEKEADKHEKLIDQVMQKEKSEVKIRRKKVPKGTIPVVCRARAIQPRRSDWRTNSHTGRTGHGANGV